jgi:ABC-type uncharacterized transport system permease subunit
VERAQALEESADFLAGYGRRFAAHIVDLTILWLAGLSLAYPFRYQLSEIGIRPLKTAIHNLETKEQMLR